MEEKGKIIKKRRIIIAICSMVLCFSLMGVTVWAAMQQSTSINSSISVSTSGQVKSIVSVSTGTLPKVNNTTPYSVGGNAISNWVEQNPTSGAKSKETNVKTWDADVCLFSASSTPIVYGFQIHIQNETDIPLTASVSFTNTSGTTYGAVSGLSVIITDNETSNLNTAYNLDSSVPPVVTYSNIPTKNNSGTKTIYVLIACTQTGGLASLSATESAKPFRINVSIDPAV